MKNMGKISTFQMFSILFICRVITLFTFILPSTSNLSSGDKIITTIPVMIFGLVYTAIVLFIIKFNDNKGIIENARIYSPFTAKTTAIIYTLGFIWFAGIGLARFELFISTVMFANSDLFIMAIILLGAAVYSSLKGIEAIGRTSVIIITVLAAGIIFVISTVINEFEYTNLKPVLTDGIMPVLKFSGGVSMRAAELMTLFVTVPKVNGNLKKMTVSWIIVFSIMTMIILTVLSGVTGEYGDDQIFQLYTLTVIAKFGFLERLDDILTGIWVLCSFIQSTFLIYTSHLAIEQGFGKTKKLPVTLAVTAGIFGVYLISSKTVTAFSEIVGSSVQNILFFIIMTVIPLILTVKYLIEKRKKT